MTSTLAIRLKNLEEDSKKEFLEILSEHQSDIPKLDQETFGRVVRLAHFAGIASGEFCSAFGVTLGTLSRWRMDVASPIQYMRSRITRWVHERLVANSALT